MGAEKSRWFTWSPNVDTLVALLTEIAMIAAYWTATHLLSRGWDAVLVFGVLTNLGLNVLFPVWWIAYHRGQPLSELGITTRRWLPSLLIGVGSLSFPRSGCGRGRPASTGCPTCSLTRSSCGSLSLSSAWLQLRFDRAFGIVPGVLLGRPEFRRLPHRHLPARRVGHTADLGAVLRCHLSPDVQSADRVAAALVCRFVNGHLDGWNAVHLEPGHGLVGHPADPVGLHRLHVVEAERGQMKKPDRITITTYWLDWLLLPIMLGAGWLTFRWAMADFNLASSLGAVGLRCRLGPSLFRWLSAQSAG